MFKTLGIGTFMLVTTTLGTSAFAQNTEKEYTYNYTITLSSSKYSQPISMSLLETSSKNKKDEKISIFTQRNYVEKIDSIETKNGTKTTLTPATLITGYNIVISPPENPNEPQKIKIKKLESKSTEQQTKSDETEIVSIEKTMTENTVESISTEDGIFTISYTYKEIK